MFTFGVRSHVYHTHTHSFEIHDKTSGALMMSSIVSGYSLVDWFPVLVLLVLVLHVG